MSSGLLARGTAVGPDLRTGHSSSGQTTGDVAVVGLGYVGLACCLSAVASGLDTRGVDVSTDRLSAIARGAVDLGDPDLRTLADALESGRMAVTDDAAVLDTASAVLICVPTPIDSNHVPDLTALHAACAAVVAHARRGQVLVLSSTSYVGTTRDLLAGPLSDRGLSVGDDVFVAYSPERVDPANFDYPQRRVPRVVGGVTPECTRRAAALLERLSESVHPVGSPEAAELTKLFENGFRAVNIALANELTDICAALGLEPREVLDAAATKPYGYMPFEPGPGVGGHCIPVDPHYLLWQLRACAVFPEVISTAMTAIAGRPARMVERIAAGLAETGVLLRGAKILIVGAAYKPGVRDVRGAPAAEIIQSLLDRGAHCSLHDSLVPQLVLPSGEIIDSIELPDLGVYDAVVLLTVHPGFDYGALDAGKRVFDCTYRSPSLLTRPGLVCGAGTGRHGGAS